MTVRIPGFKCDIPYRIPPTLPFNLYCLGNWFDINVRVIVIVPGVLHEVVEDTWSPMRLETGEYLVTTPDGTTYRHREGIYSARRAGVDFECKHPKLNPAKAGRRRSASDDALAHSGRLIQMSTTSIIDGVNGYLMDIWRLAQGRDDLDLLRAEVISDLSKLTLRPYARWCERMRLTLWHSEKGDHRRLIDYYQIMVARISIESVMSRLSEALRDVQRRGHPPGLLDLHLPSHDRFKMAADISATSSTLRQLGDGLLDERKLILTAKELDRCAHELKHGTAKGAKNKLNRALLNFDLL